MRRVKFIPSRAKLVSVALGVAASCHVGPSVTRADGSTTNHPFPGVAIFSETRTNPPNRLHVALVDLTNPNIRLRVAPGGPDPDGDGPWQTTLMRPTRIAEREGMMLVVNGDFFRARGVRDAEGTNSAYRSEVWSAVNGPAVSAGKAWSVATNARPCLVVEEANRVTIRRLARPAGNEKELVAGNTRLLHSGKVVIQTNRLRHPRTAVGLDGQRKRLVLLVVDGRKPGVAVGMTYEELAQEMLRLGCHEALNLDGGGSSVMAVRGTTAEPLKILNDPTDGRERAVANVLGVVPASKPSARSVPPPRP